MGTPLADELLVPGTALIKADYFLELRTRIKVQVVRFGHEGHAFINPIIPRITTIQAETLTELSTAVINALDTALASRRSAVSRLQGA